MRQVLSDGPSVRVTCHFMSDEQEDLEVSWCFQHCQPLKGLCGGWQMGIRLVSWYLSSVIPIRAGGWGLVRKLVFKPVNQLGLYEGWRMGIRCRLTNWEGEHQKGRLSSSK